MRTGTSFQRIVRVALPIVIAGLAGRVFASHDFVPDVPVLRAGVLHSPRTITRNDLGDLSALASLPPGAVIDAIHRLPSGEWLLSVESPVELGGAPFDRRDIILWDGGSGYTLFLGGAAAGIPAFANVDALMIDQATGDLVFSFDVPVTLSGVVWEPADLVRYDGADFAAFFSASGTLPPVPAWANVTGADAFGSLLLLTFDVPLTLGAMTFAPGEVVSWDGVSFGSFFKDAAWPANGTLEGLGEADNCVQEICDGIDNNCDGLADEIDVDGDGVGFCFGDCNDSDPGAFGLPEPIANLDGQQIGGAIRFTWDSQSALAGPGTVYDGFGGLISALGPTGDFSTGGCAADDLATAWFDDTRTPPPGDALYIFFRAQNGCGTGTYGTPAHDAGAALSSAACP